jgi:hypothetical protein
VLLLGDAWITALTVRSMDSCIYLLSAYDLTSRAVYGLMCRGRGVS